MDMEEASGAATAQGDLADVVARANATAWSFTTQHRPPPPPAPAAHMTSRRYPAGGLIMAACEEEQRPISVVVGADAVMFEAAPVDPHLSTSGYGLPHHPQQQQMPVQISQHACCGREGGGDVDGDDAMMRISPAARHHQMIKRKSEVRKVVCIPAPPATTGRATAGGGGEVIPSDLWAWRKYGQKPIKGSPYPRGYYRCSSSKGCLARKQVERSRSDPNMLVITYTAEHNHPWPMQRNVLSGYARAHTHAGASSSSSASKKHKTTNVATSSSNNHSVRPKQDGIGGDQTAGNMVAADGDNGAVGIRDGGVMYERCNGVVQPDEVFAELEELLKPDDSMVNANICSKGATYDYEWHKL